MKQELWLSRDNSGKGVTGLYEIHDEDPGSCVGGYYPEGVIDGVFPRAFHQAVEGARLRKGRKKRIKRILIELED